MPHRALRKGMRGRDRGIGVLPRNRLEDRQFPRGIPEQFRQLPFAPSINIGQGMRGETMMPMPMQPLRGPTEENPMQFHTPQEEMPMLGPIEYRVDPLQGGRGEPDVYPVAEQVPMQRIPEELIQQRIDQISQFGQEPMMGARYGDMGLSFGFGGEVTNLPDYTTGYAGGGIANLIRYYGR